MLGGELGWKGRRLVVSHPWLSAIKQMPNQLGTSDNAFSLLERVSVTHLASCGSFRILITGYIQMGIYTFNSVTFVIYIYIYSYFLKSSLIFYNRTYTTFCFFSCQHFQFLISESVFSYKTRKHSLGIQPSILITIIIIRILSNTYKAYSVSSTVPSALQI